jgi:hypothetical protein
LHQHSGNFNFSQAQQGGKDIRFIKQDNAFLPYEIERWDESTGYAEYGELVANATLMKQSVMFNMSRNLSFIGIVKISTAHNDAEIRPG